MVCDQLATAMRAELSAQEDPESAERLIAELQRAQERATELKSRSARWQLQLSDGIIDLQSDIDYDLRDRLRQISREAEELADEGDPAEVWDQYAGWVHQQVAAAASANFVWATQRARYLAEQVSELFAETGAKALPNLQLVSAGGVHSQVAGMERPDTEALKVGAKALSGLRGGYMGALMFGMMTSMAGLALINPVSIGAGVLMGGKAIKDEKKRALARRQNDAKIAMRRHIDDVSFQVGKDSRDMLRGIQRSLRDHFTTVAEEMQTSLSESISAAQTAVQSQANRSSRINDLRAELDRIDALRKRAEALGGPAG
ncbi:MAG: Isoniazid-inducible protein iniA, partial [Geminicoccaceae bacterium]